jgi:hypothetical protein
VDAAQPLQETRGEHQLEDTQGDAYNVAYPAHPVLGFLRSNYSSMPSTNSVWHHNVGHSWVVRQDRGGEAGP